MTIEIKDSKELFSLFGKIYWIETQLELASQWEAYFMVKEQKHRDIIFRISHDSEAHKSIIELLSKNLEGIDLARSTEEMKVEGFKFRKLHVEEVMAEIMRYEEVAKDMYSRMYSHTSKELIKKIWKGDNPDKYFRLMKWLITQEKAHIQLLQPYAGQIERIL